MTKCCVHGQYLLHCSTGTSACLGGALGSNLAAPRGTDSSRTPYLQWYRTLYHAMLVPRAGGMATEQLWGQAVWHPWAQPSRVPLGPGSLSPVQLGGIASDGPIPSLQRVSPCRFSPKSLFQRLIAVWIPRLPSIPSTFGCPPHSPHSLHSPIPFRLSCLGEEEAEESGEGEKELKETSGRRGGRRGSTGEEEQGIQLATKNLMDRKWQFHTRSALERYQTRFGSDVQGGSGDFRDKALMNRTRHVAFK